jgi:hypothetical protein
MRVSRSSTPAALEILSDLIYPPGKRRASRRLNDGGFYVTWRVSPTSTLHRLEDRTALRELDGAFHAVHLDDGVAGHRIRSVDGGCR